MILSIHRFGEFFGALYQDKQGKPLAPFPWQVRLSKQVFERGWPACIDLPTASGKTACIDIAVFVLACQALVETNKRTVGRRIFFTVNRRVIVDEAFDRAKKLAERLLQAVAMNENGILREVADALRDISGDKDAPPLDIAQLRGGIYRDRAWARSITQPIVVCTTTDQLGSRLLFRGYGVSPSMQPVHAALTACDSLILLDEAHVTKAFSQTLGLLSRYRQLDKSGPPMRFVQMTATPYEVKYRFGLDHLDLTHPVLKTRQEASKPAELAPVGKKSIVDDIVKRAVKAVEGAFQAIGIIVNRVQTARVIHAKLAEHFGEDAHLVIGRMRPIDRDELQKKLRTLVGPDRPDVLDKPVFVVATQCLEVGADYDFDALFTECASIDALRQRFGRLNRTGRPIEVVAAIITNDASLKDEDPIYGNALKNTWDWLNESNRQSVDFGILAFKKLWDGLDDSKRQTMLAPAPDAAVLLPAHLDALCQTSPQPVPSPDVSFFIHGPQRDMAEVNVCWRADLIDKNVAHWPEIVRLLPPTSPECMTVPLWEVRRWMLGNAIGRTEPDADVPVLPNEEEQEPDRTIDQPKPRVVVWRYGRKPGEDTDPRRQLVGFTTDDPIDLRSGDTIVVPTSSRSWHVLGHIPEAVPSRHDRGTIESDGVKRAETDEEWKTRCTSLDRSLDVAERATRQSKLRFVRRIHPVFEGSKVLRGLSDSALRQAFIEQNLIPAEWAQTPVARLERHPYPDSNEENPDEVIVFKRLLDSPENLVLPSDDEDDGDDNLNERDQFVSLADHTRHVVERADAALGKLGLNGLAAVVRTSARLHDLGKADARFQAMLAGVTPYEAMMRPALLGKGDGQRRTVAEKRVIRTRAMLPEDFRHEMLSVEIVQGRQSDLVKDAKINLDLLLHLIAAHHGHARPFAPVCIDDPTEAEREGDNATAFADRRSVVMRKSDHNWPDIEITDEERGGWIPSHRLDSGVAERFWKLTRKHGWWGLAWLESILRLADQQASAAEQEGESK